MADTKERILTAALGLFSRHGYEAVSVADIAGELGITKGALYRHYESKRAIFDALVARMVALDTERARKYSVPEVGFEAAPEGYKTTSLSALHDFTLAQFDFWTQDDFATPFRRMLTLEQYRDTEMAQLYRNCLVIGPARYTEDIFREHMATGAMPTDDAAALALEYCAPLFWLIAAADLGENLPLCRASLAAHLDRFEAAHMNQGEKS